ncbi:MAG TPA: response regulator transcription factor [Candidatus Fimimorpha faecalis]|uniref:Stage 0 sporulation protein A homolog n=1 Tax=Candidatus Fimimorpha faecalis TaxID=2840824 RepID=A0A9D1EDG3_9FIRM|nr:response regulator transcription factor [Candidatus Fimimorpha faecalis]
MMKVGICDDDQRFLSQMEQSMEELKKKYHYEVQIELYSDGKELLEDFENGIGLDLIFLDIEMKQVDGIETARKIREKDYHILIVYVSSYEQYLMQLFEVEPFRFLKKPLQREQLEDVFLKAQKRIEEKQKSYYRFQFGKTVIQVLQKDILYFESAGRKVIVHTVEKQYEYYDKLDQVEEKLKEGHFLRIHKAYLVNIENIEAFQYERVALIDGTLLNISEKNRARVRNEFWEYYKYADKMGNH